MIKNIPKSIRLRPIVALFIEEIARKNKLSFSETVNNYIEENIKNGKQETQINKRLDSIEEDTKEIRNVLLILAEHTSDLVNKVEGKEIV